MTLRPVEGETRETFLRRVWALLSDIEAAATFETVPENLGTMRIRVEFPDEYTYSAIAGAFRFPLTVARSIGDNCRILAFERTYYVDANTWVMSP